MRELGEGPVRRVSVESFDIDRYPVSNGEFSRFVERTGYRTLAERSPDRAWDPPDRQRGGRPGSLVFHPTAGPVDLRHPGRWWRWTPGANWRHPQGPGSSLAGRMDHPVVHVCLADAQAYAAWAGRMLPTEAQWECAAHAGLAGAEYAWGEDRYPGGQQLANWWQGDFPWHAGSVDATVVGSHQAAGHRTYDLTGSVWEWTRDWYPEGHHADAGPDRRPAGAARGDQGRLVPLHGRLLPPVPAARPPAAAGRRRHEPPRIPLRPAGLSPTDPGIPRGGGGAMVDRGTRTGTGALARRWAWLGAAVFAGCAVWFGTGLGGPRASLVVSDLIQIVLAFAAGAACLAAGARGGGPARGWRLIGAGLTLWGLGQCAWSYYEVVLGVPGPQLSIADIGYLGMVPLALAGMALLVGTSDGSLRRIVEGLIIAGALLFVSWATVLGPAFAQAHDGPRTWLEWSVNVAYPVGDFALASMAFILLTRVPRGERWPAILLGAGSLALAVADSFYLSGSLTYQSGRLTDLGWVAGFLLIGQAAVLARRGDRLSDSAPAPTWIVLPYLPPLLATGTSIVVSMHHGRLGPFLFTLGTVLFALVIIRQLLALAENRRLTRELAITVDELREHEARLSRRAYYDPLTGLANRAQFQHDFERRAQDAQGDLVVLYLDLDGFKRVNDGYGHAAGDALLVAVSRRLGACVRAGDTVARLGGDEFAILAENLPPAHVAALAQRVVAELGRPFELPGAKVRISASVGTARAPHGDADIGELVRQADVAMYTAKLTGKARHITFTPSLDTSIRTAAPA